MKCVVVDARVGYPWSSLEIWVEKQPVKKFAIQSFPQQITLSLFSPHEDQQEAGRQSAKELMEALGLTLPELAHHQPPQVVAASYARKIRQVSWLGWPFTGVPEKLKVIEVTEEKGISEHHHKKYTNYHFAGTDQTVARDDAINGGYTGPIGGTVWRYGEFINARAQPIEVPDDFLLWFDKDKQDRGDQEAWAAQKSLQLKGTELQKIFYQIKFELADVLYQQELHHKISANQPGGIFDLSPDIRYALSGLLMMSRPRWTAEEIYWMGVKGKLPNREWNGLWETNKK